MIISQDTACPNFRKYSKNSEFNFNYSRKKLLLDFWLVSEYVSEIYQR